MTCVVVAPERAPWVDEVLRSAALTQARVFAPWATRADAAVYGSRVQFEAVPLWRYLRGVASRVVEPLAVKVAVRRAVGWWAAQSVARQGLATDALFAPSLGARALFALRPNAKKTLVLDLPVLRLLHEDLDTAAREYPQCSILQNYRAAHAVTVQQREEWHLAEEVWVRTAWARRVLVRAGVEQSRLVPLSADARGVVVKHAPGSRRVLLAGTTASRYGLEVALRALELANATDVRLWVRAGDGTTPASLRHPSVSVLPADVREVAVEAVWAPSWVEAQLGEVEAAANAGVPVVATERALGWLRQGPGVRVMAVGDASALAGAVLPKRRGSVAEPFQPPLDSRVPAQRRHHHGERARPDPAVDGEWREPSPH